MEHNLPRLPFNLSAATTGTVAVRGGPADQDLDDLLAAATNTRARESAATQATLGDMARERETRETNRHAQQVLQARASYFRAFGWRNLTLTAGIWCVATLAALAFAVPLASGLLDRRSRGS